MGKPAVDLSWMFKGNCLNTKVNMFPDNIHGVNQAEAVCKPDGKPACPVLAQCKEYALTNGIKHGTWGGTCQRERERIRKKSRQGKRGPVPGPGCRTNGKERLTFATQNDAWAAAPSHWPYQCDACGMWHLSNKRRAA